MRALAPTSRELDHGREQAAIGSLLEPLLHPAEAEFAQNTMGDAAGFSLTGSPLLHFSRRQDMVAWLPTSLDG